MKKINKKAGINFLVLLMALLIVFGAFSNPDVAQAANDASIKLTYSFGKPTLETGSLGYSIKISGLSAINQAGMPDLPSLPVSVLLPAGKTVASVSVTPGKLTTVQDVMVAPALQNRPIEDDSSDGQSQFYNTSVYNEGEAYPSGMISQGVVSQTRGYYVFSAVLYPAVYKNGSLTYANSIQLDIKLKDNKAKPDYYPTKEDEKYLSWDIDNLTALSSYYEGASLESAGSSKILGSEEAEYVIITNGEMKAAFGVLASNRKAGGMTSYVVTTNDIYKKYTGYDNAEKIRNCIIDLYKNNGTKYILLGGDADEDNPIIPARQLYCEYEQDDETYIEYIASDLYYSNLDGDFDYDKDGIYGEETDGISGGEIDLTSDVYVGRAPVDNVNEANNFVYKTISYEQAAKTGKALMAAEQLDSNSSCAAEYVLSLAPDDIKADEVANNMRDLRDHFLSKEAIELYYNAKDYVVEVLVRNPELALRLAKVAAQYQQSLKAYVSGGKLEPLSEAQAKDLSDAFADMSKAFSSCRIDSEYRESLITICDDFAALFSKAEGKTIGEIFEASDMYSDKPAKVDKLDNIYGGDYKDQIIYGRSDEYFTTTGINETYAVSTLYDRDGTWSDNQLIKKLNSNSFDVINHLGHANTQTMMKLSVSQVRKLTNTRLFLLYSQGCYAGSFDNMQSTGTVDTDDCIAEEFLLASRKSGAFALIVNSRYGWYSTDIDKSASNLYDRMFWSKAVESDNKQLGYLLSAAKEEFISYVPQADLARYCYFEINLLGDPAVRLGKAQVDKVVGGKLKRTYYENSSIVKAVEYYGASNTTGVYRVHYYTDGVRTSYKIYNKSGKLTTLVELYSSGKTKKVHYYSTSTGKRTAYKIYDTAGRMTNYVYMYGDGVKPKKMNYYIPSTGKRTAYKLYDTAGRMTRYAVCFADGKNAKKMNYYNAATGKRTGYKMYRADGSCSCWVKCDSKGKPTVATYYDEKGKVSKVVQY